MKIKITASIFALAAFTSLAQPSLPTTNSYIVPIANPYSGSWIYYTTDSISGLGYLNGASITSLMTVSNDVVSYVNTATNGFVTAAVTNGLATTDYVLMIGLNDTNNTTSVSNLVYLAAQSYADTIGANATNFTTSVSNSLATAAAAATTWGTTTNKTGSAAPATVYYYFTNGYPMFGIISTNN